MCFVSLAASGDKEGLDMWRIAGADLTKPGYDGKTALEVVGLRENVSAVTAHSSQHKLMTPSLSVSGSSCRWQGNGGVFNFIRYQQIHGKQFFPFSSAV